jgi:hypothetical protein
MVVAGASNKAIDKLAAGVPPVSHPSLVDSIDANERQQHLRFFRLINYYVLFDHA